ncbi:MAG: sensor domain-containing diguanylate cyclase, partial [Erysipelotrichaceae bacterium]
MIHIITKDPTFYSDWKHRLEDLGIENAIYLNQKPNRYSASLQLLDSRLQEEIQLQTKTHTICVSREKEELGLSLSDPDQVILDTLRHQEKTYQLESEKHFYQVLSAHAPFLCWVKDENHRFLYCNEAFTTYAGLQDESYYMKRSHEIWGTDQVRCEPHDRKVMQEKIELRYHDFLPSKDQIKEFEIRKIPLMDEVGEIEGVLSYAYDISNVKKMEGLMDTLINNIPFRVWFKDTEGKFIKLNQLHADFFEAKSEDLIGVCEYDLLEENKMEIIANDEELIVQPNSTISYWSEEGPQGKHEYKVYKTSVIDEQGKIAGISGFAQDITEINRTHRAIRKLAYRDPLTNLYNVRYIREQINARLANDEPVNLALLDLDNFKTIN